MESMRFKFFACLFFVHRNELVFLHERASSHTDKIVLAFLLGDRPNPMMFVVASPIKIPLRWPKLEKRHKNGWRLRVERAAFHVSKFN